MSLPDKEFRYLRHFVTSLARRLDRFCFRLALRVATEVGPSLRVNRRVQRMASEDSAEYVIDLDSLSC